MAIELISKIAPKAGGFTGMVDANQVIGTNSAGGYVPDDAISSSSITQHAGDINIDDLGDVNVGTPSDEDILIYNTASSMWTSSTQSGGVTDHSVLSNLNWAAAGHTIDEDMDFDNNQAINLVHETLSSLPAVVTAKVVYLTTDDHLYLGIP